MNRKEQIRKILRESLVNVKKIDTPEKWITNLITKLDYDDLYDEGRTWEKDDGSLKGIIYFYYDLKRKKMFINNNMVWRVLDEKWKLSQKGILTLLNKIFIEKYGYEIKKLGYIH